jgi:hypothetical protein
MVIGGDMLLLADGPCSRAVVEQRATAKGISESTLNRAKKRLGVKASKSGFHSSSWTWEMPPESDDPADVF